MTEKTIHLIDDESIIHDIFRRIFKGDEYKLIISENMSQALANHHPGVDVVIMDLMIPGTSGIEIFKQLVRVDPGIRVIFLTAFGTIESAIEAIKLGAVDYLQKPFNNLELQHRIDRVIKERKVNQENIHLKKTLNQRFSFGNIIGNSHALKQTLNLVENVAATNSTILITGESGTGKELIAKAVFANSNRRNRPFLSFNSSNIPATLFESILFGHRKGSFTGAHADRKGIFDEADGGTIFLDEIANLDNETQSKILRVLQEKEIQPLGENRSHKVDVRIIAATNVDLLEKVKIGAFREDLFYRLNIINIHLPPLRERMEDIPPLAEHFIRKYAEENHREVPGMSAEFLQKLMQYPWPGNIRELENAIQRSVILAPGATLNPEVLPAEIRSAEAASADSNYGDFNDLVNRYKRRLILDALKRNDWVQKRAADDLKIKPTTLSELIKRLDINK
ncbi:MAG: sigma-54-dependent Fis family transcriptional regulator [Candidatus Aminicenantes bacterium]|nr:sigma-54-dependent Fis family transcriptional regulator [Candidatus Aminicenantes bacterium]